MRVNEVDRWFLENGLKFLNLHFCIALGFQQQMALMYREHGGLVV